MIDLNILCAGRFCFYRYMATRIPFIKTYSTPQELVQLLKTRGMEKKLSASDNTERQWYLLCVLSIFTFIKQKTDKLIRDIRDFSFIIDCQQINDNEFFRSVRLKLPERAISTIHKRYLNCSGPNVNAWQTPVAPLTFPLQESLSSDRLSFLPYLQQNR